MPTYFRVLYSKQHYQALRERRNSSHHRPPLLWTSTWARTHSENSDDYPLECEEAGKNVKFSPNALKAFLRYARQYPDGQPWTSNEHLTAAGELAGICVFSNPVECFSWGEAEATGGLIPPEYVVLEGEYACDVPENSGVVIQLAEVVDGPMSSQAFKARHVP